MIVPYYSSNFCFDYNQLGLIPNQYNKVMRDPKFKNIQSARYSLFKNIIDTKIKLKTETQKVIRQVDIYLERSFQSNFEN